MKTDRHAPRLTYTPVNSLVYDANSRISVYVQAAPVPSSFSVTAVYEPVTGPCVACRNRPGYMNLWQALDEAWRWCVALGGVRTADGMRVVCKDVFNAEDFNWFNVRGTQHEAEVRSFLQDQTRTREGQKKS